MKKPHHDIRQIRAHREAEWKYMVKEGPKRWHFLNKIGYPVIGILLIPVGLIGLVIAIHSIISGSTAQVVGEDARGLQIYPADSVVRNIGIIFGSLALIWSGIRRRQKKKSDNNTST
jgi:hypothetical protein